MEKRLLQIVVALAACVPVLAGAAGMMQGAAMAGDAFVGAADSQFRYLSGLLVGVGVAYWLVVPRIEREGPRLFLLTLMVVIGGFSRAAGMLIVGPAGAISYAAIVMELIVAPAVYLWQMRLARLASMDAPGPWS
jgi:Domain of unknown function (DUF4345)